ncbi:glycosyltransferase family 4 protein [Castellaniella caeni]|uniref:glycosyltransferase family 4 protein n=1 Tax=Castellaniella caeni TaxID=266123 RepID=UPI00082AFD9B|nr:glycosyltransferase family 4 protein [Castellaniella caeni]
MRPLRILHAEAATGFGGQEGRIFKEMCAMRAAGHHLEALCQPHAKLTTRLRDEGFQVHTLPMDGLRNYVRGVWQTRAILRAGRFDVLNTHSRRDTLLAGVAARLAGTPLIVRTRHLAVRPKSLLAYTWVPHCVTTVSEHVRRLLIERGAAPDRVATVYSPIALPPPVAQSTLRAELRLPDAAVVVGCVAVLREKKGHRALIDAMAGLLRQRPDVFLVLVGDGSPTFEALQAYVHSLGLQAKVLFTGRRNDIANVLAAFDLFALATEQEASGTVFVEAAAAGLPVIGTDVGGVAEMLHDGVTGLLVPLHDQTALADAIQALVDDPARRRAMGQAGQRAVHEEGRFTLDALVRNTEQCYTQWLKEVS